MNARPYLPSAKFLVLAGSFFLASGLVYAASAITNPIHHPSNVVITTNGGDTFQTNWEATLYGIQANNASTSVPEPIDPATVDQLLAATDSGNLTESVGKNLLINLTNAKQQGLGNDTPTQTQIINQAVSQINNSPAAVSYTNAQLAIVTDSAATRRAYGNALIATLQAHPGADANATLLAIGYASDNNDKTQLNKLAGYQKEYGSLIKDLLTVSVPQSLAPLHLLIINDFAAMSSTYPDIATMFADPLRSLAAIQKFNTLLSEETRVFTNVAQQLQKDGILFSKDEPGSALGAFLGASS